jgi:prephenate dehydratase
MQKIAFQGESGAYSEAAAMSYFKNSIKAVACRDFNSVFTSVTGGKTKYGILPVENALTGSIYQNFDLMLKHDVWICGEVKLKIEHTLIGLKGAKLTDIREVYSHPQALGQCDKYINRQKKIQPIPHFDTAGSAQFILEEGNQSKAAIAGQQAAKDPGLRIIAKGIADNKENYTRFFIIGKKKSVKVKANDLKRAKTSIVFAFKNIPGALFKALSIFAIRDIDLGKIESRPIPGSPWKYLFYLDFYGNLEDEACQKSLKHLEEITKMLKVLGTYNAAK